MAGTQAEEAAAQLARRLDDLDAAIERNPEDAAAHRDRAETLLGLGRMEEALEGFGRAVTLQPKRASYHADLGAALSLAGAHEAALDSCAPASERAAPRSAWYDALFG